MKLEDSWKSRSRASQVSERSHKKLVAALVVKRNFSYYFLKKATENTVQTNIHYFEKIAAKFIFGLKFQS